MKKNLLYALVACLAFTFAACSDDPMDATEKHVYGPNENPYLKINNAATISTSQEIPVQRIEEPKEIKLADYAETFQSLLGMTVDEVVSGVSNGSVVFCPINTNLGQWMRNTAPTKGTHGWHYNSAGGLCDASSAMYSVEFDASKKAIVVTANSNTAAGVYSFNVGFAIDNGTNFDDYVRFSNQLSVTDPSKIILTGIKIPAGNYAAYSINFADYQNAIEVCMDMPLEQFIEEVVASGDARYSETAVPTLALYLVNEDGSWDKTSAYSANGLGFWFNSDMSVGEWNGGLFYVESRNGYVNIGRHENIASGTEISTHFVYASIEDSSKYIEFIVKGSME